MSARSDEEFVLAYRQSLGREHRNLPAEHPDRWQWEYRGTPDEREDLLARLTTDEWVPGVVEAQEELF